MGDVPLDPAVTLDYNDPRKTAARNNEANATRLGAAGAAEGLCYVLKNHALNSGC
jgi:hypothetical protein